MKIVLWLAGTCALLLTACTSAPPQPGSPPLPAQVTVLTGTSFVGGVASLTLPAVQPSESVTVIPVYATQATTPAAIDYSLATSGIEAAPVPAAHVRPHAAAPHPNQHPNQHLDQLEQTLALATELRKAGTQPLGQGLGAQDLSDNCPAPYVVGSTHCDFYVNPAGDAEQALVDTTLRFVSENAYWFVDDSYASEFSEAAFARLAATFENDIVPVDTGYFGAFPDFDGNGKIFIVFSALDGYGYVTAADFFDDDDVFAQAGRHSNEGDIFYAYVPSQATAVDPNATPEDYFSQDLPSTLVHELKHLIALGLRTQLPERSFQGFENPWFEEASAVAAEELSPFGSSLTGYAQGQSRSSLKEPASFRIVDDDPDEGPEGSSYYGYNFLQLWRVAERVGHQNFWKTWTAGPETGVANLEKTAASLGSFADMMADWAVTLMFDHTNLARAYDYQQLNLRDGSWTALAYAPLPSSVSGTTRSLAYHVGYGTGQDAVISVRSSDPTPYVVVVRFSGKLPY